MLEYVYDFFYRLLTFEVRVRVRGVTLP